MKIGIIGGSFDPIHFGHLILAEFLREYKNLEKIIFVPTGNAPHKKYRIPGEKRIKMVDLAIEANSYFASSNVELINENVSYTVGTIKYLRNICPDPEFYFIIGLDNLFELDTWNNPEDLSQVTKFIVANRISNNRKKSDAIEKCQELNKRFGFDIELVDTPIIEISSSEIRNRIDKGLSIKYLTLDSVIEYIGENELYKSE